MASAAIAQHRREIRRLFALRARYVWAMVNDRTETIASIARKAGEPEIRLRKSAEAYKDGIPDLKRP
jgi:hypothetical protein